MATLTITELTWGGLVPASGGVATPTLKYEYVDDNGDVFTTGAKVTWERARIVAYESRGRGYNPWLVGHETAASDFGQGIRSYDNAVSGNLHLDRCGADGRPPGAFPSDYKDAVRIRNTGSGTAPELGGFYFSYGQSSWSGMDFMCSFLAWVPQGYYINKHHNPLGDGGYHIFIGSSTGEDRWRIYSAMTHFGTGTISTSFFYALTGGEYGTPEAPVDWWITGALVCQVSNLNVPSSAPALDTTTGALTIPPTTATQAQALEWGAVKVTVTMNGLTTYAVSAPEQAPALDWVTVEPMTGGDPTKLASQSVKITAAENRSLTSARSGLVTYKTAGNAFAALNFSQEAATVSFGTLTAQLSYPTAAAKGGTVSPTVTWYLPFGFNGNTSNGGTITRAADGTITVTRKDANVPTTITGVTTSITYSMPLANGATLNSTSTGVVSVPSLGKTVTDGATDRGDVNVSVSVSISAGSDWGSVTASKSTTATATILQERNAKTGTSFGKVSLSVSPSSVTAAATGDTFNLSASALQTRTDTYTSGSYEVAVTPTISFGEGSTSWLTKGLSSAGNATYEVAVNSSTSSRSGSITVTASGGGSESASQTVTVAQRGASVSFSGVSVSLSYDDYAAAGGDTLYPSLSWSLTYGVNGETSGLGTITSSNYTSYSGVSVAVSYAWGNTPITGGSIDSNSGKVTTPSAGNTISTTRVALGNVKATVTVTIAAGSSAGNSSSATTSGSSAMARIDRDPNTATATREINLSVPKTEFTAAGGTMTVSATGTISYRYSSGSTTAGSGLPTTFTPSVSLSSTDGFSLNGTSFYCTSHGTTVYPSNRYTDIQAVFPSKPSYTGVTFTDGSSKSVSVKQTSNHCTGSIEVSVDKSSLSAAGETTKVYGQVVYSFSSGSKLYGTASLSSGTVTGFTFAGRTGNTAVTTGSSSPITSYVNLTAASRGATVGSARSITITASDNTKSPSVGYTKASSKNITITQVANAVTGTTYGDITITLPFTSKSVAYSSNSFSIDYVSATQAVTTSYTSGSSSTGSQGVSESIAYTSNASWITVSKDNDDGSCWVVVSENSSTSSRSGTITVSASGNGKSASATVTIEQAAAPAWGLYVSTTSLAITSAAMASSFYVTKKTTSGTAIPFTSTSQVSATSSASWLTVSSLTLTSAGQIMVSFSATANTSTIARTATIGVVSTENASKATSCMIGQQPASNIALFASPSIISLGSSSSQSSTVSISKTNNGSSVNFTSSSQIRVSSKPSWVSISLSLSSGAINAAITTTSANTSSSARGGSVVFVSTEDSTKSVSVTVAQRGGAVASAGTLTFRLYHPYPSQVISAYFNNVTSNDWWAGASDSYDGEDYLFCAMGVITNVSSSGNYVYINIEPYPTEVEDVINNLRNGDMLEMEPLYLGGENGDSPWDSWNPHFTLSAEDNDGDYASDALADALESVANGNDEQLIINMY